MKKLTLSLCALVALGSAAYAGPSRTSSYSGKETRQVQQAAMSEYYGDREIDLNVFGTYAFTGTEYRNDRYIATDHAWGGGLDIKYFFARYFGLGVEGFVLDARDVTRGNGVTSFTGFDDRQRRAIGGALGTFTFRYPIPGSRIAPYAWLGGGAVFGGGRDSRSITSNGNTFRQDVEASRTEGVGQFGGGVEIRFTRHIGLTNDFSWNVVNGSKNNFGMARVGLNFAF